MATINMTVSIKFAWWVMPYLRMHALFCRVTGKKPDLDKLCRLVTSNAKYVTK